MDFIDEISYMLYIHGWRKLQYLGKWKMIMKNGEMAMTNMIWEVLFGSP